MQQTLASLNRNLELAQTSLRLTPVTEAEAITEARANVRQAKEALRVFSYKAKPCLTRSGHALRP